METTVWSGLTGMQFPRVTVNPELGLFVLTQQKAALEIISHSHGKKVLTKLLLKIELSSHAMKYILVTLNAWMFPYSWNVLYHTICSGRSAVTQGLCNTAPTPQN